MPDNPKFQNDLAWAYYNLAYLQKNQLEDYKSAETNYNKAIEIREKLPDNPKFQNGLASAYYNLANLQQYHLNDYKSAEINYNKAIEIREGLPKGNPQFRNDLASVYNDLAYSYFYQKQYTEAIEQVNRAIDIAYDLSQKDSKYLFFWINHKHSLAEFVFNNGEVEKAKDILEEIKPLAEKCLSEKPNDRWTQTVYNGINELLAKCSNL